MCVRGNSCYIFHIIVQCLMCCRDVLYFVFQLHMSTVVPCAGLWLTDLSEANFVVVVLW